MNAAPHDFYTLGPDEQFAAMGLLAEAALTHWPGRFSDIRPVKFRENAVFSARREDGRLVAIRIHRHAYHPPEALRSELAWMRALSAEGIGVPPVVPDRTGSYLVEVSHPAVPEPRYIDLLEWLSGEPIGSAEEGVDTSGDDVIDLFEKVGKLAARIHNQSSAWSDASRILRHHWNGDGLIGPTPFWGQFWKMPGLSNGQIDLLQRARSKAAWELRAFGRSHDRYSLIHADFVPENLLYGGNQLNLIDFDDCGFGWHMFELATALFFTMHQPNYEDLKAALFRGYRQVRFLPDDHEALLPLFLFLRGTTYLGWMQTRAETRTAKEMAPMMIEQATMLARQYLSED